MSASGDEKNNIAPGKNVRPFFIAATYSEKEARLLRDGKLGEENIYYVSSAKVSSLTQAQTGKDIVRLWTGSALFCPGDDETIKTIFEDHGYDFVSPENIKAKAKQIAAKKEFNP